MNIERFITEHLSSHSAARPSSPTDRHPALPDEVRQAANLGWQVFPVSPLAKLTGNPDLLIDESTSEILRLEQLSAEYPSCQWRVAVGPSSLCVVQIVGLEGGNSFAAISQDEEECFTLQSRRGDNVWVFYRWPADTVPSQSGKKLPPGLRILADGNSCPIPPSGGCFYVNPWEEVQAVPRWLRKLGFETPDDPPAKTAPVPASPARPLLCRSAAHFAKSNREARKGYVICGQAGRRSGGYRNSRRL